MLTVTFLANEPALADQSYLWTVRAGLGSVDPKDNNGALAGTIRTDVESNSRPTVNVEYLIDMHWSINVLGALPFEHSFRLNGVTGGSFKDLPPTLTLRYRPFDGSLQPYFGVGANYTLVFGEKTQGPIAGSRLSLGNSFGFASEAGLDWEFEPRWLLSFDACLMGIKSNARLNGQAIGTVHVDPVVYGLSLGYRF